MTKLDRVLSQVFSGRWILTVLAGLSYAAFTTAVCYAMYKNPEQFKAETLVAMFSALLLIAQGVYKDYFNRPTEKDNVNGNGDGNGVPPPPPPQA